MEKQTRSPLWIALLIAVVLILILTAVFTGTKTSPSTEQTEKRFQESAGHGHASEQQKDQEP